jgi:retron-type reverse transcriptase
MEILRGYIPDKNIMWLLERIIVSFNPSQPGVIASPSASEGVAIFPANEIASSDVPLAMTHSGQGLPLGNLTSQLFCNIYMNEFDQFVKHKLKAKHYIRYADDFVFFSNSKDKLINLIPQISLFLKKRLCLRLHPDKISIKTLGSGMDFLGWVHFPNHQVLRTVTKRRAFKGIRKHPNQAVLNSYLGLMNHGNAFNLKQETLNWYGLWIKPD